MKLTNYLGQLRLYSLCDFLLMVWVLGLKGNQMLGATLLWVGFLLYLENQHKDKGRLAFPRHLWKILWGFSLFFFPIHLALIYVALSALYTRKKMGNWGLVSPLLRGLQTAVLGISAPGADSIAIITMAMLTAIRNLLGDLRDVQKDRLELRTIPVALNLPSPRRPVHLVAVCFTSFIWWIAGGLWSSLTGWLLLSAIWCVEIATYNLTPR